MGKKALRREEGNEKIKKVHALWLVLEFGLGLGLRLRWGDLDSPLPPFF